MLGLVVLGLVALLVVWDLEGEVFAEYVREKEL